MAAAVHDHRSNEAETYMVLDHLCSSFASRKDDRLKMDLFYNIHLGGGTDIRLVQYYPRPSKTLAAIYTTCYFIFIHNEQAEQ